MRAAINTTAAKGRGKAITAMLGLGTAVLMVAGCNLSHEISPVGPDTRELIAGPASPGGMMDLRTQNRAVSVQNRHGANLFSVRGVVGTGVSQDEAGNPVIMVYTEEPGVQGIPEALEGLPVRTEVIGKIISLDGNANGKSPGKGQGNNNAGGVGIGNNPGAVTDRATQRFPNDGVSPDACADIDRTARFSRAVPVGVSAGISGFSGGTYGARVKDAAGNLYMLSNNHVFAGRNSAPIGREAVQPRPQDGGRAPTDAVGQLADFEPLRFCNLGGEYGDDASSCPVNVIDAAIVSTTEELAGRSTPCEGYGTPKAAAVEPRVGMQVMKYGRTTGLTTGRIRAVNVTVHVNFGSLGNGAYRIGIFSGQIQISQEGFSSSGDSGSLLVTQDGNPVGLIFAGSSTASFANPIFPVLERFGVTVDGE